MKTEVFSLNILKKIKSIKNDYLQEYTSQYGSLLCCKKKAAELAAVVGTTIYCRPTQSKQHKVYLSVFVLYATVFKLGSLYFAQLCIFTLGWI